jgi:hypothetical protein
MTMHSVDKLAMWAVSILVRTVEGRKRLQDELLVMGA